MIQTGGRCAQKASEGAPEREAGTDVRGTLAKRVSAEDDGDTGRFVDEINDPADLSAQNLSNAPATPIFQSIRSKRIAQTRILFWFLRSQAYQYGYKCSKLVREKTYSICASNSLAKEKLLTPTFDMR